MLIQETLFTQFSKSCQTILSIDALILIGSMGRREIKANSDIDCQILVLSDFDREFFEKKLEERFQKELKHLIYLEAKNKYCLFLTESYISLEVFLCYRMEDLDKYYLGSEIEQAEQAIIFDRTKKLKNYLDNITQQKSTNLVSIQNRKAEHLLRSFENYFAGLSTAHARRDGYKYSLLYGHALNALIRMIYLLKSDGKYEFMPPNFFIAFSESLQLEVEKWVDSDLNLANKHKRKLLDLFKKYLPAISQKFKLNRDQNKIVFFLEQIYQRDFFWNFRDAAKFNRHFKNGIIYRSSSLSSYQKESFFVDFLKEKKISQLIDLRAEREIAAHQYSDSSKALFDYIHAPFDPWNQRVEFKNIYHSGTNPEIAYRFFMLECKPSIKLVMEKILANKGATLIHCHAGKDRTGILIILLHLLTEADRSTLLIDYLASEMDTNENLFLIIFEEIEKAGGILPYLLSCQLSAQQIEHLKKKINPRINDL